MKEISEEEYLKNRKIVNDFFRVCGVDDLIAPTELISDIQESVEKAKTLTVNEESIGITGNYDPVGYNVWLECHYSRFETMDEYIGRRHKMDRLDESDKNRLKTLITMYPEYAKKFISDIN